MFLPQTFVAALIMTILSTICWGSFANTLKLTKNFRFELYYWSYAVGIFAISVVLALTMGSTAPTSDSFLNNLSTTAPSNLWFAALAGFIFNIANVLLIAGVEIAGLAVAFPVAIGIALVEGVLLSYALQPKGSAAWLGAGVALAVVAILLIGKAYGEMASSKAAAATVTGGSGSSAAIPQRRGPSRKGVIVCIISGLLMGTWAPLVTRAMNTNPAATPYTVVVMLAFGALVCCFVFNTILMKRPVVGTPLSFKDLARAPFRYHLLGLLGGAIWGVGMTFNLVAAKPLGNAISYAIGQASPMIAAMWGVFAWHEFRGASGRAKAYLAGMFACYIGALVLIANAYRAM